MPGGSTGSGAKAGGRFYRSASFTMSNSLTQLLLDADSSILVPDNVQRNAGDMLTFVAGRGYAQMSLRATGIALLTGIRVVMTRSPGSGRELVFCDAILRAPTLGDFTIGAAASVDLDVDDTVRIEVAAQGVLSLNTVQVGELNAWAHLLMA